MKTETPKLARTSIYRAVEALLETGARQAVVYQHPKLCVKVTRRFKPDRRNTRTDIALTIGAPNYAGRQFIKACLKAGEPFPIRKTQLKFYPKKARR